MADGQVIESGSGASAPDATPAWYDGFKNPEVKEWVKAYNGAYPDPEALATKALHLERFVGADKAGRGIIVPKPDAKPEEWTEFYRKTGASTNLADYKIPEGYEKAPAIAKFREEAVKMGMPARMFDGVMNFIKTSAEASDQAELAQFEAQAERETNEIKSEWGKDYDRKRELGRRAAQTFVEHTDAKDLETKLNMLEGALGTKGFYKLWAAIGEGIAEDRFIAGDGSGAMSGGMTPAGARVRIDELKRDQGFAAKLRANDTDAKAEWDRLHKIGYSG